MFFVWFARTRVSDSSRRRGITQEAKGDGGWEKYDRCIRLADELFGRATSDLENALNVSYLEHLDFDGPRGPKAWERLTPRLKVGWKEMQQYLEDLAAKGKPRDSR